MDFRKIVATMTLTFCAGVASAQEFVSSGLVTYRVTARVLDVYDPANVLDGVNIGDTISGTYAVNTTEPDANPDPSMGSYYQWAGEGAHINLTLKNNVLKTSPSATEPLILAVDNLSYEGQDTFDRYAFDSHRNESLANGATVDKMAIEFSDFQGTALSSDQLSADLPFSSGFDEKRITFGGHSSDFASFYYVWAEIVGIDVLPPMVVSPPSGMYERRQNFDMAVIFSPGTTPSPVQATLNGVDITPYVEAACIPSPTTQNRFSLVCPDFNALLQPGPNVLEIAVPPVGGPLKAGVVYEVIGE